MKLSVLTILMLTIYVIHKFISFFNDYVQIETVKNVKKFPEAEFVDLGSTNSVSGAKELELEIPLFKNPATII